jgi:hypothetical protein
MDVMANDTAILQLWSFLYVVGPVMLGVIIILIGLVAFAFASDRKQQKRYDKYLKGLRY